MSGGNRRDRQRKRKKAPVMKKWLCPVSPMRLTWNNTMFISLFLYDAAILMSVPLMRVSGDSASYQVQYLWHMVIRSCHECGAATPNEPPFPMQMKKDDEKHVWYWECPACGVLTYPHFVEAFVEAGSYGKLSLKQTQGTNDDMNEKVREAWNMTNVYIDSMHKAHKEQQKLIQRLDPK